MDGAPRSAGRPPPQPRQREWATLSASEGADQVGSVRVRPTL